MLLRSLTHLEGPRVWYTAEDIAVAQSLSCVGLFATARTAARQASLSFTVSWSLLKLMSVESVMPSNHLILYHPLLLPSIFLSINSSALSFLHSPTLTSIHDHWKNRSLD